MVNRKVKTQGIANQPITGVITESIRSGGHCGFNIYTIAVDPECYDRVSEATVTRTEWNVEII